MAALDLPFNDVYLSHLHQIRNARKAAAKQSSSLLFTSLTLDSLDEMSAATATAATTVTDTSLRPSSLEIRASDTAILSQYPSSLVRLLVLLAPVIAFSTRFVRLATWTAGPGTASHSFLLLLAWWAVCLYGYETLRYAPQAVLLSILLYNGLIRAHQGINNKVTTATSRPITSDNINVIIDNVTELADFFSTLSSTLLEPLLSLFSWKSVDETRALTVLLITSWPLWVLCFGRGIWDVLRLPRIVLEVRQHAMRLFTIMSPTLRSQGQKSLTWGRQHLPTLFRGGDYLQNHLHRAFHYAQPLGSHIAAWSSTLTRSSSFNVTVFPPFPLFSLSVRHLFLVLGTVALTWCSPWCALIRHALWRSALVRQSTRKTIAVLSGQRPSTVYPYPPTAALDQSLMSSTFDNAKFSGQSMTEVPSTIEAQQVNKDITRHEDVTYRFTIFENQRWWMGLDWTAALLPQERPSWADESNNPVSPPSSFSLPIAKTTLKPAPTSTNPQAYIKRLVRWQWIDAEWTVAGRDSVGDALGLQTKTRRDSSTSHSGTLFSNSSAASATSGTVDGDRDANGRRMSSSSTLSAGNGSIGELPSDLQWLDVDAEGWQYGDNSWEKMSRKGGLGRYTRRRRWIRRAVLVEVVQKNYTPTEEELKVKEEIKEEGKESASESTAAPVSPTSPTSPRTGGDLKQRLSRASQGASSSKQAEAT